jgi:hypothetical protein
MDREKAFLHDISSPLTSIQLNVENSLYLLEEGGVANMEECLKVLKACLAQTTKLSEMVRKRRGEIIGENKS